MSNSIFDTLIQTLISAAIKEVKEHFDTRINEQNAIIANLSAGTVTAQPAETAEPVTTEDKKADAKASAGKGKPAAGAKGKGKAAPKDKPAVDLKPYKVQAADLLEWLVDPEVGNAQDEVEELLEKFQVSAEPEIEDAQYLEFYNELYDLADQHIDLEETPRIAA